MKTSERVWRIGRDVAGVLPRAHAALRREGRNPLSPGGLRLLGEVVMDEAALTGMTLTASPPTLERSEEACAAAADELSALGACAHARPEPLHVKTIGRRRFGRLVYERLTFEHDPLLPPSLAGSGLGGPTTAAVHLCRQGDDRRPWLVWVHGAGQGQPLDLLFSGPGASRASSGSTSRYRCSRATASVAKHGRPIRTWIRWPTSRG